MRRLALTIAVAWGLAAGGCCSYPDLRPLLRQTRDNLANDIGPKYKRYLDADTSRPEELRRNDGAVVDDTVAAIDRVLAQEGSGE